MRRPKVFLSYRRSDTAGIAGRVHDRLKEILPKGNIFFDVTAIEPGRDFKEAIEEAIERCDVMLAFIGAGWNEGGRIADDKDFVRAEIAIALKRDLPIVPVLVEGAPMPEPDALTEDIRPLHFKQAMRLAHATFDSDVAALIRTLRGEAERPPARPLLLLLHAGLGAIGLLALLLVIAIGHKAITGRALDSSIGSPATTALILAAGIGGVILGWVVYSRRRAA
jgi:hypothetical protein